MGPARLLPLIAALLALGACGADDRINEVPEPAAAALRLSTPAFIDGSRLPERYTCDGAEEEPPMYAGTVPPSTRELVLIVSDPDAEVAPYVHVTRYGISARGDGAVHDGGQTGDNSDGSKGWTAPCPPKGDGIHDYVWSVYALSDATDLGPAASPQEVVDALGRADLVLAHGTITARYGR